MIRSLIWLFGIQSAVAGIVVSSNGKVLLTKRSKFLVEGGKWCIPGGGINKWETAEVAVRRELFEEVGLRIKNVKFLFIHEEMVKKLKVHAEVFVFEVKYDGKIKNNWEVSEYAWFSKSQILKMDLAFSHKDILNKYFKLRGRK